MSKVTITVNGQNIEVDPSKMLIEEMLASNISVPHFCYHESLGVDGNCRMCMVEIAGQKRPQIACNTPIKEGMEVSTISEGIMDVKRSILELELINHPVDCPICDQAGECSLQEYYMEVGLHESRIDIDHKVKKNKHVDLGSNVVLDQERCVLCTRCTRFTSNITQTRDLVIANRGNHACVTTFEDTPLEAKGYAMNVVDLCPVGALTSKDFRFAQRVWFLKSDESICHGCSKGCNIYIDHNAPKYEDDKVYRFRPRKNLQVNGHFICDVGRLSYKSLNETRLFTPLSKKRKLKPESALGKVTKLLKQSKKTIITLSPSLSLENLATILAFAAEENIEIFAAELSSFDESFTDDMLKQTDLASNRNGIKLLGINEDKEALETALKKATLILNFNNQDLLAFDDSSKQTWVHFTMHKLPLFALQIPIKSYSEEQGLLINCDHILQTFHSTIQHQIMIPTLQEHLSGLSKQEYSLENAYDLIKENVIQLKDVNLKAIPPSGIALERDT